MEGYDYMADYYWLLLFIIFITLAAIFQGIWVYKDAKSRNLKAGLWTFLSMAGTNSSGLLSYLLFGRKSAKGINVGSNRKYVIGFVVSFIGALLSFIMVAYHLVCGNLP